MGGAAHEVDDEGFEDGAVRGCELHELEQLACLHPAQRTPAEAKTQLRHLARASVECTLRYL